MSTSVPLPALGESVTEGTVSRWLKQVGDKVEADEPIVEVSTDKVDTEIPSPVAGTILEIKVDEDDTVEVGGVLCIVGDESESGGASEGGSSDDGDKAADDAEKAKEQAEPDDAAEPESLESAPTTPSAGRDAEPKADDAQPKADAGASSESTAGKPKKSGGAAKGTEVTLPALGESVTEGTVSRWLKEVGDTIEADEAIVEVSTDKVDTEIPSPVAGTLLEIKVPEDETVEVGGVLAIVGEPSEDGGDDEPEQGGEAEDAADDEAAAGAPEADTAEAKPSAAEERKAEEGKPAQEAKPAQESKPAQEAKPAQQTPRRAAESSGADDEKVYVTPLVRKMAEEHGVDLASIKGTGVGGRIRKQDVLAAAEGGQQDQPQQEQKPATPAAQAPQQAASTSQQPKAEAPAQPKPAQAAGQPAGGQQGSQAAKPATPGADKRGTTEKLSRQRATIARRMTESLATAAQLTATVEVDLTAISRLRAQVKESFKKQEGVGLSYLPFITKATVECLKQFPILNATIDTDAGTVTYAGATNVGIAVDTEKGLIVPVVPNADDLNIAGLARKIADLADRSRTAKITPDELVGGTFTITNYGSAGTLFDTPIINQPQVGILGTGALVKRPVVMHDRNLGETIAVRDMMYLSLTYDHRLVDGAVAARFLAAVKERLEEGDFESEFGL